MRRDCISRDRPVVARTKLPKFFLKEKDVERPTQEQLNTAREVIEWFHEDSAKADLSNAEHIFQETLDNLPVEMTELDDE